MPQYMHLQYMYASIYASSHATQWNGTVIMAISIGNLFRSSSNVFVQNATDLSRWKLESTKAQEGILSIMWSMKWNEIWCLISFSDIEEEEG